MSQENNTDNKHDTNTVEIVSLRSCNKCNQLYNAAQFKNKCPLCGCVKYTEVAQNTEELQVFQSIQGYTVIPPRVKKQKEVFYQYHCLNKECNGKFWSATVVKECVWCHSKNIERTGTQKEV